MPENKTMSRRRFIKNSSYAAGGAIGGGFLGTILGKQAFNNQSTTTTTTPTNTDSGSNKQFGHALMYFQRQKDFEILSSATERIFPEDENGPGAIELGVPFFIDHQLAGGYGHNEREYMQGPFYPGSNFQGYQTRLKRHEVFSVGIEAIERESQKAHNASFVDLEGQQQDEILQKFQNGEVNLKGVTSGTFFELLRSATLEGAYADPLYGGNDNMRGWMMKEFPGSYMSYVNEITKEEFIKKEPRPLRAHIKS